MTDPKVIAEQFLAALAANTSAAFEAVLAEDVTLRLSTCEGTEAYRPRALAIERLQQEWARWPDPALQPGSLLAGEGRAAIEFRIQATEPGLDRYVEHNRAAFLTIADGQIKLIDLYCPAPLPSARRTGWVAPATLSEAEVRSLFAQFAYMLDTREWVPPHFMGLMSLRQWRGGVPDAHPSSRRIGGMRWTAEEADANIQAIIEEHRRRNASFAWHVGPTDQPADLRERLERHGLVLAGYSSQMARLGLDALDIPTNPEVTVELLDGSDETAARAMAEITGIAFHWTAEKVAERLPGFLERLRDPEVRKREPNYLARLNGTPVATARLVLQAGMAFLGGAATLPEYRGNKIYSTLLRRRLEHARDCGYHVAAILAQPMSRRVVERYGFKEYGREYIYAWMPVIDPDVIRSLVPNE